MRPFTRSSSFSLFVGLLAFMLASAATARAGFFFSSPETDYALLFEGGGNNTLQITNVTMKGDIGVGNTGKVTVSGPSTINGSIDFSANQACTPNCAQFSDNNAANVITGGVNYNVAAVVTAFTDVNNLNTTLGAEAGTSVSIGTGTGKTLTINASAGVLDASGNRVFNVTGFNTTNGDLLTINGDAAGDNVVLNFTSSVNFNNQVKLVGISSDHVLYNFVGGSGLSGGPTLQINNNLSNNTPNCSLGIYCVQGVFLDPNGAVSITNANILGRVFGGDSHDFQYVSGSTITAPTTPPVPEPTSILLLGTVLAFTGALFRRRLSQGS
jgi:PEP-CTERM motif